MPAVSVILPTFNRARFLPEAFASIRAQTFTDWELIVVDDGSTDDTAELTAEFSRSIPQPVRYIHQENRGAYGARNTGLDNATGRYIAFFDSDDLWLPHHLADCAAALAAHSDVSWVYGACRLVDEATGQVVAASSFHVNGAPRPFMRLSAQKAGDLAIIDDSRAVRCAILSGLFSGLQNSVMRRDCFAGVRFEQESRNEAEDQLIVIRMLKRGVTFAYFDREHVIYRIHAENSSGSALGASLNRRIQVHQLMLAGYEQLGQSLLFTSPERRALRRRLSREYFWHLGYSLYWQNGQRREARKMFARGLANWPWDPLYWKTWLGSRLRLLLAGD